MPTEAELQKKYDDAVERHEAAVKFREVAEERRGEKFASALKTQNGTKEYYLAQAEWYKALMTFTEKQEQECTSKSGECACYVDLMVHKHGADSKEAQIAKQRAELNRTQEFVYNCCSPFWTKWDKLTYSAWLVYLLLRAEDYNSDADELHRARRAFCECVENESNGWVLFEGREAALEALSKLADKDDRTAWDAAKQNNDAALAKWNEFTPKGEKHAEELEDKINECVKKCPMVFLCSAALIQRVLENKIEQKDHGIWELRHEVTQMGGRIEELEAEMEQKDGEIAVLKDQVGENGKRIQNLEEQVDQKSHEMSELQSEMRRQKAIIEEMQSWARSFTHVVNTLIQGQCQYFAESEASPRITLEKEWRNGFDDMHTKHTKWFQDRIIEWVMLEEE